MKKTLVVISMEKTAMVQHMADLKTFFGAQLGVEGYYYHGNTAFPRQIRGDLIVLTAQELTATVWDRVNVATPILYMERTLFKHQAARLKERLTAERMLFVDYREDTAMRMISSLTEFGVRGIRMTPVGQETSTAYLEEMKCAGVKTAVTPGLGHFCPLEMEHIIDIGWAPIDAKTLLEIAVILKLYEESLEKKLFRYMKELITSERNIMFFMKSMILSKNQWQTIMENMEDGVLITDKAGYVQNWNSSFLGLLKLRPGSRMTAWELEERLPDPLKEILRSQELLQDKLIFIPKIRQSLVVTKQKIAIFEETEGYMLICKGLTGVQQHNARIRRQMHQNNYHARYTFDDILGSSEKIAQSRKSAARLARTDATVLITGESGTGKELFAQSIHNASKRSGMPFVAINCAALSPSLLESELFGYERGAFTDSRPEGHIGVFEMAHKGTVFLDEVGELSMNVQAKLLRVLEEREIRRVGGEENIPIDVRVIAATNQDLQALIEEKQFRQDLYFRLNVLPLKLIPLRERREDILILARHFLEELNAGGRKMTPRLEEAMYHYPWKGNGRELYNCMQYMACLSDDVMDVDSLPDYLRNGNTIELQKEILPCGGLSAEILDILAGDPVGRELLTELLRERGFPVSEYAVRKALAEMKRNGLIVYGRGRTGIRLTPDRMKKHKMDDNHP